MVLETCMASTHLLPIRLLPDGLGNLHDLEPSRGNKEGVENLQRLMEHRTDLRNKDAVQNLQKVTEHRTDPEFMDIKN